MSTKKSKKRVRVSEEEDTDMKEEIMHSEDLTREDMAAPASAGDSSPKTKPAATAGAAAAVSPKAKLPAAAALAAVSAAGAVAAAAGAGAAAFESDVLRSGLAASSRSVDLEHSKQKALSKIGLLFGQLEAQKKAHTDFKEKEAAELEKFEKERQQFVSKGADLRTKYEQTEDLLKLINQAVASGDAVAIERAVQTDPAAIRGRTESKSNRAVFPPQSPQRAVQTTPTKASPASSPAKLRNVPDIKAITLAYIERNGAWIVTGKRQSDPTRPCRACAGIDHWTNDAMLKGDSDKEYEWVCLKVRLWALPPVRPEPIDVSEL